MYLLRQSSEARSGLAQPPASSQAVVQQSSREVLSSQMLMLMLTQDDFAKFSATDFTRAARMGGYGYVKTMSEKQFQHLTLELISLLAT